VLAQAVGDLGGVIVAHFTINFANLRYIARVELPAAGPPLPSPEPAEP